MINLKVYSIIWTYFIMHKKHKEYEEHKDLSSKTVLRTFQ